MLPRDRITLGILAGGQARRMGGVDKALLTYRGTSLLSRTLSALGGDYAAVLISHNGARAGIARPGARVVADLRGDFPGPLAGIESLLAATRSEWLLTVPVDLRELPPGLPELLFDAADTSGQGRGVVVSDAEGLQPLLALWPVRSARRAVSSALDAGELAAHRLIESEQFRILDIAPWRLGNLNSPSDLE